MRRREEGGASAKRDGVMAVNAESTMVCRYGGSGVGGVGLCSWALQLGSIRGRTSMSFRDPSTRTTNEYSKVSDRDLLLVLYIKHENGKPNKPLKGSNEVGGK